MLSAEGMDDKSGNTKPSLDMATNGAYHAACDDHCDMEDGL
jgi:hypothetical protein